MTSRINQTLIALLLTLLVGAATLSQISYAKISAEADSGNLNQLVPEIRHARTAEEIIIKLQRRHYEKRAFDDRLSSQLLDSYLEQLDPNKHYFLQNDIDEFDGYRFILDDGIRRGNLNPSFLIFNRYQQIAINDVEQLLNNLPQRIKNLDFSLDEVITLDTDQRQWPNDIQEKTERTRKALKNSVLGLKLADKDQSEIIKTLEKRYKNQLNRLKQFNSEDVFQFYMNTLMALYDPHSGYMSPRTSENFSINMSLSLEGIGAVLSMDGEHTVVERLIKGGPAELHGQLQPNDKIVAVGQGTKGDIEDVIGWRLDEVVQLIRGKKGTSVRLEIISGDSNANLDNKSITIVRNKVKLEEQAAQKSVLDIMHDDQLKKIGVIQVSTFYHDYEGQMRGDKNYRSTTRDVQNLLDELDTDNVEGVVIDLRGNGGGYLEEARTLTGLFVERGPVVQIRMANGKIKPESNYPNANYYKKPIVVLVDRLSASASEIFAGAIQDYSRGLIVGAQSFGKGTVQQVSSLNHGALKLTEAKYYRISGGSTQHRGVLPDITLPSLYDSEQIGESTLDNALNWDTIKPLHHSKYGSFGQFNSQLMVRHTQRVKNDPDYRFLNQQIALNEQYENIKTLSLNELMREDMINKDKQAREAIENSRRIAKGLPVIDHDDTNKNSDSEDGSSTTQQVDAENDSEKDPRTDFLLTESAHILLDTIFLSEQKKQSTEQLAVRSAEQSL